MCGLAGLLDAGVDSRTSGARVSSMIDRIRHRGPDDEGIWSEDGLALGLCRLAVVDLSDAGHQPMISESGRWVIAYNGEIYNHRRIRAELEALDSSPRFRGHSDTEVILGAFDAWGLVPAIGRFVGMFAFALWDRKERELHLVRDRLGVKPLSFGRPKNGLLVFASELNAFRGERWFPPEIDLSALGEYFRLGYVPEPCSIYRGFQKVPPGTIVTFDSTGRTIRNDVYWDAHAIVSKAATERVRIGEDEAIERVEERLEDSIAIRRLADVPVGVFLSGGIDSSLVTAIMNQQTPGAVRTFTIGFEESRYDESRWARAVAEHLGTEHTEFCATASEVINAIPTIGAVFDEPFADSSQIPTWLVSKLAREQVTVSLTGDGGDEGFGGYVRHLHAKSLQRLGRLPRVVRRALGRGMEAVPEGAFVDRVLAAVPGMRGTARPGEKLRKLGKVFALDGSREQYDGLTSLWVQPPVEHESEIRVETSVPNGLSAAEVMMFLDMVEYLPGDLLTKVDRSSMAVSLEAREPLLDHRLLELAWQLPLEMKIRDGKGKWILRQILRRHLPVELIDRPKMGFAMPLGVWLREPLREWAEEMLSEDHLRGFSFLDVERIRDTWKEHCMGRGDRQHQLWTVLAFLMWAKR